MAHTRLTLKDYILMNDFSSDEARAEAERAFKENFPPHQCYWNDRLAIAVNFDLEKSFQKEAARRVILNGESGYYEPLSHFNYDVNDALIKKGVPREFLPSSLDRFPDYSHLGYEAIESIIHAFDLEISLSNSD